MLEDRVRNLVLNSTIGDCLKFMENEDYNKYKFYHNNQLCISYITQQMIITIKSLMPSKEDVSVNVDIQRFINELKLWREYRQSANNSLLKYDHPQCYWKEYDDSACARALPIVIVNNDFKIIINEIIKTTLQVTGNIISLLETISIARIFYFIANKKELDYEEIIETIKQDIIYLSIKDIIEKNQFVCDLNTYDNKYIIDFERSRIELLNVLNGTNSEAHFKVLHKCLEIIKSGNNSFEDTQPDFIYYAIISGMSGQTLQNEFVNKAFINNLISYMLKLKKGRISPEQLEIKKNLYPEVYNFKERQEFYHSLLNRCIVISKIENRNEIKMLIQNKFAKYGFCKEF